MRRYNLLEVRHLVASPARTSAGGLPARRFIGAMPMLQDWSFHRNDVLQLLARAVPGRDEGSLLRNARVLEFIAAAVYLSRRSLYKGG